MCIGIKNQQMMGFTNEGQQCNSVLQQGQPPILLCLGCSISQDGGLAVLMLGQGWPPCLNNLCGLGRSAHSYFLDAGLSLFLTFKFPSSFLALAIRCD